jgi:hypothetical protein
VVRAFPYACVFALVAEAALAQADPGVAGEWSCGGMRVYLTAAGGVELLGERYRAGRYTARGGSIAITWDDGEATRWGYAAAGGALTLTLPGRGAVDCRKR